MQVNHRNNFGLRAVALIFAVTLTARWSDAEQPSPAVLAARLELMQKKTGQIEIESDVDSFPIKLDAQPLFRYSDVERGYVDGAIWILGEKNACPKAIITTELNPDFYGQGPKIIYEFLSLTDESFAMSSPDFPAWRPNRSESKWFSFPNSAKPAQSAEKRLQQMKSMALRCKAWQNVSGKRKLRMTSEPIVRYQNDKEGFDGAVFVFSYFTMPGIVLVLESDRSEWRYAVGRLSRGTELGLSIDGNLTWQKPPVGRSWTSSFTSSNAAVTIPE